MKLVTPWVFSHVSQLFFVGGPRCALFTALALFTGTITELFFAVRGVPSRVAKPRKPPRELRKTGRIRRAGWTRGGFVVILMFEVLSCQGLCRQPKKKR